MRGRGDSNVPVLDGSGRQLHVRMREKPILAAEKQMHEWRFLSW